jgi:hypothetical protein
LKIFHIGASANGLTKQEDDCLAYFDLNISSIIHHFLKSQQEVLFWKFYSLERVKGGGADPAEEGDQIITEK